MPNSVGLEVEEVDIFQFANVPFTINAFFKDINTNQIRTGETSNLKVLLAFEGNASSEFRCKEHHPNLLEVVSNTGIQDNGRATIVVKIKDVSMNHDHKRFVVYLEAYRPQGNNNIIGAITNPITTIQHKLVIAESYSAPFIWYKDEGAKDKCIKVNVRLVDSNQQVVTNRPVPLTANLVYSSGQIVQPSTVLTIFHDKESKVLSIGENGTEIIKFRVNEVSRNHRKQLFHLLVAADASQDPNFSDISPATSIPFEVKSKRSSDARKEHIAKGLTADEDSSDDIIISAPTTSVRTNTSKETQSTNISSTGNSATTVTATTSAISLSGSTKKSRTNISDTPLPAVSASSHSSSITPASSSNVNAKRLTNVPTGSSSSSVAPTVAAENPTVASGVVPPTPAVSITAMNQGGNIVNLSCFLTLLNS
jgi:ribosome-binding factor A